MGVVLPALGLGYGLVSGWCSVGQVAPTRTEGSYQEHEVSLGVTEVTLTNTTNCATIVWRGDKQTDRCESCPPTMPTRTEGSSKLRRGEQTTWHDISSPPQSHTNWTM